MVVVSKGHRKGTRGMVRHQDRGLGWVLKHRTAGSGVYGDGASQELSDWADCRQVARKVRPMPRARHQARRLRNELQRLGHPRLANAIANVRGTWAIRLDAGTETSLTRDQVETICGIARHMFKPADPRAWEPIPDFWWAWMSAPAHRQLPDPQQEFCGYIIEQVDAGWLAGEVVVPTLAQAKLWVRATLEDEARS